MRVIETFYTLVFSGRTSTETREVAVNIRGAGGGTGWSRSTSWEYTNGVGRALGVSSLGSSPLRYGTVSAVRAFNTATSLDVTLWSTVIDTLVIRGTEVYTLERNWIAVRVYVVSVRRSIEIITCGAAVEEVAVGATTVFVAVDYLARDLDIAITVGSALYTSSTGNIAYRLVGLETTIVETVGICCTSLAR